MKDPVDVIARTILDISSFEPIEQANLIVAALSRAGLVIQQGWQPIEGAPEETDVLVWCPGWLEGGEARCFDDGRGWWMAGSHPTDATGPDRIYPTHWMPLPAKPASDEPRSHADDDLRELEPVRRGP